jgi:hypothetical protein
MKRCPTCARGYDDDTAFCLDDGAALTSLSARTLGDLVGPRHSGSRARALLAAAARALAGLDPARLAPALLPEDLELVDDDPDAPRVLVAIDLDARRRDDPRSLARLAAMRPPESLRGDPAMTPASVVYGLGCIGYALVTGALPFDGTSPAAVQVRKLLEATPRADTDDDLATLLADAMSPEAAARPALVRFTEAPPPRPPRPPRWRPRRRPPWRLPSVRHKPLRRNEICAPHAGSGEARCSSPGSPWPRSARWARSPSPEAIPAHPRPRCRSPPPKRPRRTAPRRPAPNPRPLPVPAPLPMPAMQPLPPVVEAPPQVQPAPLPRPAPRPRRARTASRRPAPPSARGTRGAPGLGGGRVDDVWGG